MLPWDVQVRLENAASWARTLDKARHRRKPQPMAKQDTEGQVFMLKIFVGCEYECPRGHRFFMNSPETILRGGAGIYQIQFKKLFLRLIGMTLNQLCYRNRKRRWQ